MKSSKFKRFAIKYGYPGIDLDPEEKFPWSKLPKDLKSLIVSTVDDPFKLACLNSEFYKIVNSFRTGEKLLELLKHTYWKPRGETILSLITPNQVKEFSREDLLDYYILIWCRNNNGEYFPFKHICDLKIYKFVEQFVVKITESEIKNFQRNCLENREFDFIEYFKCDVNKIKNELLKAEKYGMVIELSKKFPLKINFDQFFQMFIKNLSYYCLKDFSEMLDKPLTEEQVRKLLNNFISINYLKLNCFKEILPKMNLEGDLKASAMVAGVIPFDFDWWINHGKRNWGNAIHYFDKVEQFFEIFPTERSDLVLFLEVFTNKFPNEPVCNIVFESLKKIKFEAFSHCEYFENFDKILSYDLDEYLEKIGNKMLNTDYSSTNCKNIDLLYYLAVRKPKYRTSRFKEHLNNKDVVFKIK